MNNPLEASTSVDQPYQGLDANSYTANRLVSVTGLLNRLPFANWCSLFQQHCSPLHLNYTTRRCFIGPIPEGWLNSHRKTWYKEKIGLGDYSSRRATFTTSSTISPQKRLTGLDGPSAGALFGRSSFPQPENLREDEGGDTSQEQSDVEGATELAPVNTAQAAEEELRNPEVEQHDVPQTPSNGDHGVISATTDSQGLLKPPKPQSRRRKSDTRDDQSFVTANERLKSLPGKKSGQPAPDTAQFDGTGASSIHDRGELDTVVNSGPSASLNEQSPARSSLPPADTNSVSSLLPRKSKLDNRSIGSRANKGPLQRQEPEADVDDGSYVPQTKKHGIAFDLAENVTSQQDKMQERLRRAQKTTSNRFRRKALKDGEIVKMEKMLVRVDSTLHKLPPDYNENDSLKTESRIMEKWREYVVVCRHTEDETADFTLQMYKTRVIPEVEKKEVKKKSTHDIPLQEKTTKVNLYSSLDKTFVIWYPYKKMTMIYIFRPHSSAHSVEWYTFLKEALGWTRPSTLQINIPDLSVALRIERPFEQLEVSRDAMQGSGWDDTALHRTMAEEQAVARRIITKCMTMLEDSPEWASILETWSKAEKMGLAWKRYDRLEWIHGANEKKMYGSLAMIKSHDLELRPKEHYPTKVPSPDGKTVREPPPVEGFLIRLTSQKGRHQRMGKMFFKRLYFSTHNQYLCFCRPAKAVPPTPPKFPSKRGPSIPSTSEIVEHTPLIFSVNPYPVEDGEVSWLKQGNPVHTSRRDEEAYNEHNRNAQIVSDSDGYVNMCKVVEVRNVVRGASPADATVDEGPDVEFHQDVPDTRREDGATDQFDDGRTFELLMKNGLVMRLQTYNEETKKEWMKRLSELVQYWKLRIAADMELFKMIRRVNLERLNIDEEMEATLGQFAQKWEVARSAASPQLYHMCGISSCRSILVSYPPMFSIEPILIW
jgi:hypothetical protein